jgi:molecular chaperone GrpE
LDVYDNLERAMQESSDVEKSSNLYKGIELTLNAGISTLRRFQITQMDEGMGTNFNPDHHDVIFQAPQPGAEPGTIMHVVSKGYFIGDRVLRAAKVGVVRK